MMPESADSPVEWLSDSEDQTRALGAQFAPCLEPGTLVGLEGDLGSGKTRFVQGLARGLGVPVDEVSSPTFVLCHIYEGRRRLLHVDAYRLNSLDEVDDLGIDEALSRGDLVVVEWADRIAPALPVERITIQFDERDRTQRSLRATAKDASGGRTLERWRTAVARTGD